MFVPLFVEPARVLGEDHDPVAPQVVHTEYGVALHQLLVVKKELTCTFYDFLEAHKIGICVEDYLDERVKAVLLVGAFEPYVVRKDPYLVISGA